MIQTIVIIGSGNVAWHLAECITLSGFKVLQVYGRNKKDGESFEAYEHIQYITEWSKITPSADAYFICVNDDAIEEVAGSLPFALHENQILLHTSGSVPSTILAGYARHYASFWPVQSMIKESPIVSNEMPVVITPSDDETGRIVGSFAEQITEDFLFLDDDKKRALHLAAVIINNFTNHLYALTADYCREEDIDFSVLSSLIKETALKTEWNEPGDIQTGPAKRKDSLIIEKQLQKLEKHPELYKLYCIFTESIIKKYS